MSESLNEWVIECNADAVEYWLTVVCSLQDTSKMFVQQDVESAVQSNAWHYDNNWMCRLYKRLAVISDKTKSTQFPFCTQMQQSMQTDSQQQNAAYRTMRSVTYQ